MNLRCTAVALLAMQMLDSTTLFGQAQSARTAPQTTPAPTRLIILGADHSAQLVGRRNHPGFLRVFLDRLKPEVICIEQPPDEYARGVFYFESTYEQQYVVVPYAKSHHIEIRPIDWLPSRDDERLAFGRLEVVDVPPVRPPNGFQSFISFDSTASARSFFFADSSAWREDARKFFETPNAGRRDFPRRLDLYRTYMQAMRIRAAALQHPGETVLVVVGAMHKDDLERTLSDNKQLRIQQPSSAVTAIDSASASAALTPLDQFAIAAVNTLGVQSQEGPVDWNWVEATVRQLATDRGKSSEVRLIETRLAVLRRQITPAAAITVYERIANDTAANVPFTFTGVQDTRRVDSYFDPFGNLSVRQRSIVEAARLHVSLGNAARAEGLRASLIKSASWSPLQEGELAVYWRRYVDEMSSPPRSR